MFKFKFVEDESAVRELLALRYDVFVKEWGWLETNEPEIDEDEWEAHSLHIGGYTGNSEPVGTLRVVHDSPLGFPGERVHDFSAVIKRETTIEASRLAVLRGWRGRGSAALIGLGRGVYQAGKLFGKSHWMAVMDTNVVKVLKQLGFHFEYEASTTVYYIGSDCTALVCSMEETRRVMYSEALESRLREPPIEEFELSPESLGRLSPRFAWSGNAPL